MVTRHYAEIGSISSGTMRNEDLIPDFLYELEQLAKRNKNKKHIALVAEIQNKIDTIEDYFDTEDANYDLNEDLFYALNEYAKPYSFFGSHPGDGADFGFWIDDYNIREDIYSKVILSVSGLDEIPSDYHGLALEINDHGNQSLYKCWPFGHYKNIWSIV